MLMTGCKSEVLRLYKEGMIPVNISRQLGVSRQRVGQILKRNYPGYNAPPWRPSKR